MTSSLLSASTPEELFIEIEGWMVKRNLQRRAKFRCLADIRVWQEVVERYPGDTWQARWRAAECDVSGPHSTLAQKQPKQFGQIRHAMYMLIGLGMIRPSYEWLILTNIQGLREGLEKHNYAHDYQTIRNATTELNFSLGVKNRTLICATCIFAHTGKRLEEIVEEDVLIYERMHLKIGMRKKVTIIGFYSVLNHLGIISGPARVNTTVLRKEKQTPENIVEHYGIVEEPWRSFFVGHLESIQAESNHTTVMHTAYAILGFLWNDIHQNNPEQQGLKLSWEEGSAWKRRVYQGKRGQRVGAQKIFQEVRRLYQHLNNLVEQYPEEWGVHAASCPVSAADIRREGRRAAEQQVQKRIRIGRTLPYVAIIREHLLSESIRSRKLLEMNLEAKNGEEFYFEGKKYIRVGRETETTNNPSYFTLRTNDDQTQTKLRIGHAEERSFLLWAVVEILLATGMRVSELTRLRIDDIGERTNSNGQLIPCIRLPAGKTEFPRVIDIPPHLLAVIDQIITRVQGDLLNYPEVDRYEYATKEYICNIPYLLQRKYESYRVGLSGAELTTWLSNAREGLWNQGGLPKEISFSLHDCRRLIATRLHQQGDSILSISRLLGHRFLDTTVKYIGYNEDEFSATLKDVWK